MYGGYMGGFGYFGWFLMIAFWCLIIWAIFHATNMKPMGRDDQALEILKKRYAKGEIDKKEFEQKKNDLLK